MIGGTGSVAQCGIVWKVWNVVWKISTLSAPALHRVLLYGGNMGPSTLRLCPDGGQIRKMIENKPVLIGNKPIMIDNKAFVINRLPLFVLYSVTLHLQQNIYKVIMNDKFQILKISFCITCKNRLHQIRQTLLKNIEDNRRLQELVEFVLYTEEILPVNLSLMMGIRVFTR